MYNHTKFRLGKTVFLFSTLVCSIALHGCAKNVSIKDIDPNHHSDGNWLAAVQKTNPRQTFQNWQLSCVDTSRDMKFRVKDSVLRMYFNKQAFNTYVDKSGYFRLVMPTGFSANSSPQSDDSLINSKITFIIDGELDGDEKNGHLTVGIDRFGGGGCRSEVLYSKLENAKSTR